MVTIIKKIEISLQTCVYIETRFDYTEKCMSEYNNVVYRIKNNNYFVGQRDKGEVEKGMIDFLF